MFDIDQIIERIARANELGGKRILLTFDWRKAANIIKLLKPDVEVMAGLMGDYERTCQLIYRNGAMSSPTCWLSSTWATPVMRIGSMVIYCYKVVHSRSDISDGWTPTALYILGSNDESST